MCTSFNQRTFVFWVKHITSFTPCQYPAQKNVLGIVKALNCKVKFYPFVEFNPAKSYTSNGGI